jgi:hypothetical protein
MTNPTSNFGWQMPTPTDLVTDLPADFEVFGQAVDTSMADLKGGTTGQILSKATNADMDFTWITNDVGDITNIAVTSPITGGGSSGSVTIGVSAASTSASGVVQLSDSTSTTSSVLASTPTATKSAYDLAAAAVPKSTVTTAGDVIYATGSSAVTRLGIGSAGQVLTVAGGAPSWATPSVPQNLYYAGKNKIINGDFLINQRAFTTSTSSGLYPADRTIMFNAGGTCTTSRQNFTPGTAPVAGYEGRNYIQAAISGQSASTDYYQLRQLIEDVTNFANQTVTLSFWAKANTGTPSIAANFVQNFGSGGSPSAATFATTAQKTAITTSWVRYSLTFAIASIAGKTLGTTANTSSLELRLYLSAGTAFNSESSSLGIQTNTFDIWGIQIEAGSTATDFQTASGSLGGELALCQRYYYRNTLPTATAVGTSLGRSSTVSDSIAQFPVTMRTNPTAIEFSGTWSLTDPGVAAYTVTTFTFVHASLQTGYFRPTTASGLNQGKVYTLDGPTSGYIGFSAEL